MACCPWCTVPHTTVRCAPVRANGCKTVFRLCHFVIFGGFMDLFIIHKIAFEGEPESDRLHMTLAYKYDKMDSITLSSMLDRFEYVDASSWEIRLYSRDIRVGQNQVRKNGFHLSVLKTFFTKKMMKIFSKNCEIDFHILFQTPHI